MPSTIQTPATLPKGATVQITYTAAGSVTTMYAPQAQPSCVPLGFPRGCLIAPDKFLYVTHTPIEIGSKITFPGGFFAQVTSTQEFPAWSYSVATLDRSLPIDPAKLIDATYSTLPGRGNGFPLIMWDQSNFPQRVNISSAYGQSVSFRHDAYVPVAGDSGSPCFIRRGKDLILMGLAYSPYISYLLGHPSVGGPIKALPGVQAAGITASVVTTGIVA